MPSDNTYHPSDGYIPDAQTAAIIGTEVLGAMCNDTFSIGMITVEYDDVNRLWKANNGNAFVVIEQDSGKIVRALFQK